jgi:hypothetical protein
MALNQDTEQEFAPQNKKPPTEDEKRYIYIYILMIKNILSEMLFQTCLIFYFIFCDKKERENCAWKFDESFDEAWWG